MRTPRPGRASFVDTYAGELDLLSSNLCIVFVLLCEFAGILAATRSLRIGVADSNWYCLGAFDGHSEIRQANPAKTQLGRLARVLERLETCNLLDCDHTG